MPFAISIYLQTALSTSMEPLTTLILLAMVFNLLENTFVAVVAYIIYRQQKQATAEMERRINEAIADVKNSMKSDAVLGAIKKDVKKTLNGWFGGKKSGANRSIKQVAQGLGATRMVLATMKETTDPLEKVLILGEYASQKFQEHEAKKEKEPEEPQEEITSVEVYKESNMSPEDYKKAYEDGLKIVGEREKTVDERNGAIT